MKSVSVCKAFMRICGKSYLTTKHSACHSTMRKEGDMEAFHMAYKTNVHTNMYAHISYSSDIAKG